MQTEQAFYSVTINGKSWSRDAIAAAEFQRRGYTVAPARLIGDSSLFDADGHLVAHLFANRRDAAQHVAGL